MVFTRGIGSTSLSMLIAALLSLAAAPSLEELVRAQAAKIEKLSSAVDVLRAGTTGQWTLSGCNPPCM